MTTAHGSLRGGIPRLEHGKGNPEALKYGRMWAQPAYRAVAPGEQLAATFLQHARPRAGSHILDFGCGTGRGALMLAILAPSVRVTMLDFVRNCLDPEIQQALTTQADTLAFVKHDLEQPIALRAPYGYCTDVMEHIPEDRVDRVLAHVLLAAQHVFFSIATTDDVCGQLIGETLHLTVRPAAWWLAKLQALDYVVHWAEESPDRLLVYGSAWRTGRQVSDLMVLNVGEAQIRANVAHNLQQGWRQVVPHPTNDLECMILGGGPSLNDFAAEITRQRAEGMKLITLNGAYTWALEHGLTPSAQIIVDVRAFNARFTKPVVEGCRYLIASQCDSAVLEGLPQDRTWLWHANPALIRDLLDAHLPAWYCIPGGSTVLLRAIPLLRMLGYARFHLYGADSCVMATGHHAYPQPENHDDRTIPVILSGSGRVFHCTPWMLSQAEEFQALIKQLGDVFELQVHGDGLLAHILETGAKLAREDVLIGITHEEE